MPDWFKRFIQCSTWTQFHEQSKGGGTARTYMFISRYVDYNAQNAYRLSLPSVNENWQIQLANHSSRRLHHHFLDLSYSQKSKRISDELQSRCIQYKICMVVNNVIKVCKSPHLLGSSITEFTLLDSNSMLWEQWMSQKCKFVVR